MAQAAPVVRFLKAVGSAAVFVPFWIGAPILGWLVFPLLDVLWRRRSRDERMERYQRIASRGFALLEHMMRWFRLHDFHPGRARIVAPDGAFVLVANHPTLVDVVALTAVMPKLCCIAKPMMCRNPLTGRLVRYLGYIEAAPSGSPMAGAAVMQASMERLKAGFPVLIFPEGTRSPVGAIGPMTRGAFEIAARAKVPVLPVFISCTPLVLGRGMPWYEMPKQRPHFQLVPLPVSRVDDGPGGAAAATAHYRELFACRLAALETVERSVAGCEGLARE
jgi:1-acyl-sn-glycerol-3-phosphate acyltransferase